jgi:uncharacterized membrane protein YebE (DUF533 family)
MMMVQWMKNAWSKLAIALAMLAGIAFAVWRALQPKRQVPTAPVKPADTHRARADDEAEEVRLRGEIRAAEVREEAARTDGKLDQIEQELKTNPENGRDELASHLRNVL